MSPGQRNYYYLDFLLVKERQWNGEVKLFQRKLRCSTELPLRDAQSLDNLFEELEYLRSEGDRKGLRNLQKSTAIIQKPEIFRRFKS